MQTIALNILDIVQNSIRAKASVIRIGIKESRSADILEITIEDNGSGIPETLLKTVTNPFVTTRNTRKMGLGLPLLKYHAELTGGDLRIDSVEGSGTVVKTSFTLSHIDRQPIGDMAGVMIILINANPDINFLYTHITDTGVYCFSSGEIKDYLGIDNFSGTGLLSDIRLMINENLKDINIADVQK